MKYFTKEWCLGKLSDNKVNRILNDYNNYIKNIYEKLPLPLKLLTKNMYLHDGIITNVIFFKDKLSIELSGIFGDLQFGYYKLDIKYFNIDYIENEILKNIFFNKNIKILSDEIELLINDRFSHKFFFDTDKEIEIIFSNIKICISDASKKDYKNVICKVDIK